MIDPTVRPAAAGDAGPLNVLEDEARAALVDTRGGNRWLEEHPPIGPSWDRAVDSRQVFVAELTFPGDLPLLVGYLVLDRAGDIAMVDQVYVTPGARELGFGDSLLEAATEAARSGGAVVIEGQALPGDRETKNLYERAGITARLITVSRALR
ncbi:MAG: GNAT family N-acetyltransferase [Ilumatobacteraceae bacterium]